VSDKPSAVPEAVEKRARVKSSMIRGWQPSWDQSQGTLTH
jgi:hypothetical protein